MSGREKALELYLNLACAGLYRLERQTVRDELEANLLERVREFQVMGCSRNVALDKALEEFGAPSSVNRGMREVYIMPKVMKGGALAGLIVVGTYLAISSSSANVSYLLRPKEICAQPGYRWKCVESGGVWVDMADWLKVSGVKPIRIQATDNTWKGPSGQAQTPPKQAGLFIETSQGQIWLARKPSDIFAKGNHWYMPLEVALSRNFFSQEVRLVQLNPLKLKVKTSLGWKEQSFPETDFRQTLELMLQQELNRMSAFPSDVTTMSPDLTSELTHHYSAPVPKNQLESFYALIESVSTPLGKRVYNISLSQSERNGTLTLKASQPQLEFKSDWKESAFLQPGQALVVRLSKRLDTDLLDTSSILVPKPAR